MQQGLPAEIKTLLPSFAFQQIGKNKDGCEMPDNLKSSLNYENIRSINAILIVVNSR